MIAYSFFNQGMRLPKNRVQYDLDVLRNSTFSAGRDIPQQLQSNAEVTEGISSHLRSTLRRLREATTLPDLNQLDGYDQTQLDARQAEINDLIQLYSNQVSADYKTCRLDKEKLIMLSHLSQQQSMEVLEVNLRLAQVMEANQTQLKTSVEDDLLRTVSEMETHIQTMLDKNRDTIRNAVRDLSDSITPYSVSDMDNVLTSQKKLMEDVIAKNALLVSENSELRMHMSFIPVEYRDFIKNLQKSNHQQYRNQRKTPQVIIPETDHRDGGSIELENAPMTHPAVAFAFRDAQYSTLSEARQLMDKGFALKARITTDPHTKVIPKGEAPWRQEATYVPEPPKQDAFDRHSSQMPIPAPPTRGHWAPH
jgi:hypothetical protein